MLRLRIIAPGDHIIHLQWTDVTAFCTYDIVDFFVISNISSDSGTDTVVSRSITVCFRCDYLLIKSCNCSCSGDIRTVKNRITSCRNLIPDIRYGVFPTSGLG